MIFSGLIIELLLVWFGKRHAGFWVAAAGFVAILLCHVLRSYPTRL